MAQTVDAKTLYNRDFHLWLEDAIARLRAGDFHNLDIEHLLEELEGLAARDRRELVSRLRVLLEHILKRCYAHSIYDNRGWESTIETQRQELKELLRQSPSLKRYFTERFEDCYQDALSLVTRNYPGTMFPDEWQFTGDVDAVLTETFWE
jgi:hypothetical protein